MEIQRKIVESKNPPSNREVWWFDTNTEVLKRYTGNAWVQVVDSAELEYDDSGTVIETTYEEAKALYESGKIIPGIKYKFEYSQYFSTFSESGYDTYSMRTECDIKVYINKLNVLKCEGYIREIDRTFEGDYSFLNPMPCGTLEIGAWDDTENVIYENVHLQYINQANILVTNDSNLNLLTELGVEYEIIEENPDGKITIFKNCYIFEFIDGLGDQNTFILNKDFIGYCMTHQFTNLQATFNHLKNKTGIITNALIDGSIFQAYIYSGYCESSADLSDCEINIYGNYITNGQFIEPRAISNVHGIAYNVTHLRDASSDKVNLIINDVQFAK